MTDILYIPGIDVPGKEIERSRLLQILDESSDIAVVTLTPEHASKGIILDNLVTPTKAKLDGNDVIFRQVGQDMHREDLLGTERVSDQYAPTGIVRLPPVKDAKTSYFAIVYEGKPHSGTGDAPALSNVSDYTHFLSLHMVKEEGTTMTHYYFGAIPLSLDDIAGRQLVIGDDFIARPDGGDQYQLSRFRKLGENIYPTTQRMTWQRPLTAKEQESQKKHESESVAYTSVSRDQAVDALLNIFSRDYYFSSLAVGSVANEVQQLKGLCREFAGCDGVPELQDHKNQTFYAISDHAKALKSELSVLVAKVPDGPIPYGEYSVIVENLPS